MTDEQPIELYRRVADGDEAAFRILVATHAPQLLKLATRITGSAAVADDLVQDTFLKLWLTRDQLAELDNPAAWIRKICFFHSVNYIRRQAIHDRVIGSISYNNEQSGNRQPVNEQLDHSQLQALVHEAVQRLPEKQQRIYRMSRGQGLSIAEISGETGLAVSTVKNLMVMALKEIRSALQRAGYPLLVLLILESYHWFLKK